MTRGHRAVLLGLASAALVCNGCSGSSAEDPTAFCGAIASASRPDADVTTLDLESSDSVQGAISELELVEKVAPEVVAADARAVVQVYTKVLQALVDTPPGARPELLADFQADFDAVAAPASRLQRYAEDTCAIEFAPPPMPTPTPTPLDIVD